MDKEAFFYCELVLNIDSVIKVEPSGYFFFNALADINKL